MTLFDPDAAVSDIASNAHVVEELPDDTLDDITAKELGYRSLRESAPFKALSLACDVWAAAPLAEKRDGLPILTQRAVDRALDGSLSDEAITTVKALRDEYSLFHWHLEFPEVFSRGGFDLVLGNPPWDTLSPDVKEFFSTFDPQVRFQDRDGQRAIVEQLLETPQISRAWRDNSRHSTPQCTRSRTAAATACSLLATSARATSTSTECSPRRRSPSQVHNGYTAQIVPENLANGANAAAIRKELFDRRRLDLLITFENRREVWFKGIDSRTVFCLYSARREMPPNASAPRSTSATSKRCAPPNRAAPHSACARRGVLARRASDYALLFTGRNRGRDEGILAVPAIRR